jgi:DNA-binding response OmpR family regulator
MDKSISILVVDDDRDILAATARLLQNGGFPVFQAEGGEEALVAVRHNRPDLVLLDVNLPDVSGVEVCRRIKDDAELKQTFVVLLSGSMISSDNQSEGLEIGADGYIARPIANRELLARIQAFARIIRVERERDQLIAQLRQALAEIKKLSGFLPICAQCKKIRTDSGYWQQIEEYLLEHSEAQFSHGICPECEKILYGEFLSEENG